MDTVHEVCLMGVGKSGLSLHRGGGRMKWQLMIRRVQAGLIEMWRERWGMEGHLGGECTAKHFFPTFFFQSRPK